MRGHSFLSIIIIINVSYIRQTWMRSIHFWDWWSIPILDLKFFRIWIDHVHKNNLLFNFFTKKALFLTKIWLQIVFSLKYHSYPFSIIGYRSIQFWTWWSSPLLIKFVYGIGKVELCEIGFGIEPMPEYSANVLNLLSDDAWWPNSTRDN